MTCSLSRVIESDSTDGAKLQEPWARTAAVTTLVAVVHVGEAPPLGGGLRPAVVAHLYGGSVPRFVVHEVADDGTMVRVPGGYAPDFEADPSYPVTDLLLATRRGPSAVAERLDVLDTKARANYGVGFREKTFDSDVARGSVGYGRHYEARSQLEAHRYEGRIVVSVRPDAPREIRDALVANLDRLDAPVDRFEPLSTDGPR
jgi:hypothetical protein